MKHKKISGRLLAAALAASLFLFAASTAPASPSGAPEALHSPEKIDAGDCQDAEGTLVCNCNPPGAEVFLDEVSIGEAPLRKEHIQTGEHTLALVKPGYEKSTGTVTIKKDVTLTVDDKLAEARGEIKIDSEPQGAAISLDGREAGITPVTLSRISGGTHKVSIDKDYFEHSELTVDILSGGSKEIKTALLRRVIFINVDSRAGDRAMEAIGRLKGIKVIPAAVDELKALLCARELDPSSLGFLGCKKNNLELEDSAVLASLLEQERAELAIALSEKKEGDARVATISLYCSHSNCPDVLNIKYKDEKGLNKGLDRFNAQWEAQSSSGQAFLGAMLVDRAEGGAETVSVLKGLPAAAAGIIPGDIIKAVDGKAARGKNDIMKLLKPGVSQDLTIQRRKEVFKLNLISSLAPVEAPPDSASYLFNLAMVLVSERPRPEIGEAITLGNACLRSGEYDKALKTYQGVQTDAKSGICRGTALYRMGQLYEKTGLWTLAASSYRELCILYPDATLISPDGPLAAPLASARLKELFYSGLVKERWWL